MGDGKVSFIIGAFAFITVITQIGALIGGDLITNAPPRPTTPSNSLNVLEFIQYSFSNLGYFFSLMRVSSAYAWAGAICSIFVVGIIWCIIEIVRGV
jgi:hypothetical protein